MVTYLLGTNTTSVADILHDTTSAEPRRRVKFRVECWATSGNFICREVIEHWVRTLMYVVQ